MTTAEAAADVGTATLIFSLVVAGIIIFILGSLVWWFLRDRIQQTHARLNAGNQKFEKQDHEIEAVKESMQANVQAVHQNYIHRDVCKDHRDAFGKAFEKQEQSLAKIAESQACNDKKLTAVQSEVSTGFKTLTRLVAQSREETT